MEIHVVLKFHYQTFKKKKKNICHLKREGNYFAAHALANQTVRHIHDETWMMAILRCIYDTIMLELNVRFLFG